MSEQEQARWYVIHTYSGHENKVKATIEKAVQSRGMEDLIQNVAVPVEDVVETKNGKEKIRQRKVFPGYVLIKMIVTDESWYVVRNTKGVTGFVGPNSKPVALTPEEVENMGVEKTETSQAIIDLSIGDKIEVTSGPFIGFSGTIEGINPEKKYLKVNISMFGRETPLELEFAQVKKQND
ncbi:transcriptional antiterminator NusG [Acetoanaerobium pronyense]|uniref:Transcription termination/antitermination protein NusG n=1 Tax=Acetoanaerobium pronyense TaxID=1482736 RepID=A0ABS4KMB7_9FIRM|nr:transcription termination/antitermination protein NusG [Acetoanaerobium pronyense]MBP2028895.1 transcriptional antiterminator NusG [Acetoanaerobium pronyense]